MAPSGLWCASNKLRVNKFVLFTFTNDEETGSNRVKPVWGYATKNITTLKDELGENAFISISI